MVAEALKHAVVVLHITTVLQRPSSYHSPIWQADRGLPTHYRIMILMLQIRLKMTVLLHRIDQTSIKPVAILAASWWHAPTARQQSPHYGGVMKADIPFVMLVVSRS